MSDCPHPASETLDLLIRWHDGDRSSLERLLERDLDFVKDYVRKRIGPRLLQKGELDDYVQDAMVRALQYTPRFLISDRDQFRALLARITENTLRDHAVHQQALKRSDRRERPLLGDSMLQLDPPAAEVTRPSQAAQRADDRAWVRLGLELLPGEDRMIVRLREWEKKSFAEIGEQLGIQADAARMRFQRVLPKLARQVSRLRRGDVAGALQEFEA